VQVYQVRGALDALAARLAAQARFRLDPALIAGRPQGRARPRRQGHDRRRPAPSTTRSTPPPATR
jgi:hypothetical protein